MKEKIDLTGQNFGLLTVLHESLNNKSGLPRKWVCQCECGKIKEINQSNLTNGTTKSCGCLVTNVEYSIHGNLTGQKFGRWTVLELDTNNTNKRRKWICKCECGTIKSVDQKSLINGKSKSCGCYRKEKRLELSKDITGQKFGRWTALYKGEQNDKGNTCWICQCDCGTIRSVEYSRLINGSSKSCGCYQKYAASKANMKDITGQKFGRLIALEALNDRSHGNVRWRCQCDCGNITITNAGSLLNGSTKSCGCLLQEINHQSKNIKHGDSNTRLYKEWYSIKDRCLNPNARTYKHYGGRGITICEE